jgi:hypothetical protein
MSSVDFGLRSNCQPPSATFGPMPTGPAMTPANMRENGVRSLSVSCALYGHQATISTDRRADDVHVADLGPAELLIVADADVSEIAGACHWTGVEVAGYSQRSIAVLILRQHAEPRSRSPGSCKKNSPTEWWGSGSIGK